jgi:hypothetical protein
MAPLIPQKREGQSALKDSDVRDHGNPTEDEPEPAENCRGGMPVDGIL